MNKNILTVVGITILFLGTCITPSVAIDTIEQSSMPTSNGKTLYVGGSGEGNYTKIQDAIDDAIHGDTVFVYDDSSPYKENLTVDKSINLVGENSDTTIIDGSRSGDVVTIFANQVNINGFTIQNSGDYDNAICWGFYSNNVITGNIITNNDEGIWFYSSNNNTITNNTIKHTGSGIYYSSAIHFSHSSNNIIGGNIIILNNCYGILLYNSSTNTIINNTINSNNYQGIRISGEGSSYNIISGNTISNNNVGIKLFTDWFEDSNHHNTIIGNNVSNNDVGGIGLYRSTINTITGNHISDNNYGIDLHYSSRNTISSNNISNNDDGINLDESSSNNIISNNESGIHLYESNYNNITDNNILNNDDGIYLHEYSNYNTIAGNTISNNQDGIHLRYYSIDNAITSNIISSNNKCGIHLDRDSSNNNTIYHNNFIDNTENAYDESNNTWDDGYPSGGNYWSDYNGTDKNGDGIGDIPYPIPGGDNEDRYPFINPNGWTNSRPNIPIITGPTNGRKRVWYEYNFSISDPDGDSLWIHIDWEHGTPGKWDGPFSSGSIIKYNYSWRKKGTYTIRAQTMDGNGLLSDWGTLTVTIPRTRASSYLWYQWFLERFPLLEKLLNLIR